MFKVECPGCQAPYQVDERRVPPSGLKMRCPKCGTSFQVDPPPPDPRGTSPSPVLGGSPGKPPLPTQGKAKPAVKGTMLGVAPPLPSVGGKPPGGKPPLPRPGATAGKALPSGAGGKPPLPRPGKPSPPQAEADELDLPAPARGAIAPAFDADLAAPRRGDVGADFELDLPSPAGGSDLPSPVGGAPGPPSPSDELDFSMLDDDAGDLPLMGSGDDLPSPARRGASAGPGAGADLPAPARGAARNADLPAPRGNVELPSPTGGAALPSPAGGRRSADGDVGLPSPAAGAGLPSPASGGFDLPSPASDLPSLSGGLDLPSVGGAELPSVSEGTGLPVPSAGLPSPGGSKDAFGELDLPMAGADLPMPGADMPAAPLDDPFGTSAEDRLSDPFGEPQAGHEPDPFSGTLDASVDSFGGPEEQADPFGQFGDMPPAGPDAGAAGVTRQAAGGTEYGEVSLDAGGQEPLGLHGAEGDASADLGGSLEGGLGGDLDEDLGADLSGGEIRDDMEFGEIPDDRGAAARGAPRPTGAVAELQAKRRRKRLRLALAGVFTVIVAGGALTLLPRVGPFGAYFIYDQINQGQYERALSDLVELGREKLGADTYPAAREFLEAAEKSSHAATRYQPLKAYAAYAGLVQILRFGPDPEVRAAAKVRLDELSDADAEMLPLARASMAAVEGQLARARESLDRIAASRPRDADVAIVSAEVELNARDHEAAVAAWKKAAELEKSARTSFGLARAFLAAGNRKAAKEHAEAALAANRAHVGARILLAQVVWDTEGDEDAATKLLEEAMADKAAASPEELVRAHTLIGEIHLTRGRISHAEEAFAAALKLNPKAARALAGFGDALYRAGRYSQALARFKAATQADPDDLGAKLGIAKTSIQLERLEEAKGALDKLRKTHPKDMQVAYWYGRVLEALGDKIAAEKAYREAIENGKDDPQAVHAYVALAAIQSAAGLLDEAQKTLTDAKERLPSSPAIHKALGRVAMSQGRYEDALKEFERALELDDGDVDAKFLVGNALTRLREFDRALSIYEEIGKLDRDYPGLALERGLLFQESGRQEEALKEYEAALAKAPNDADLMLKVGCGKAAAGAGAEAEEILRKVLAHRPNSAETHHCLGRALFVKGNLSDALTSAKRAVQLDPNRAVYHLYVGWIASESGSLGEASRSLEQALALDQGLAEAYWQRGVLSYRRTRPKDALADLLKALSLRPALEAAHADLAMAYRDLGMEQQALSEWERAIAAKPDNATWRFRYGKLLNLNLRHAEAVKQLEKAIALADDGGRSESWVPEAHRLLAISLGQVPAAIEHWQAYLKLSPTDSPFRAEAMDALRNLGKPWDQ